MGPRDTCIKLATLFTGFWFVSGVIALLPFFPSVQIDSQLQRLSERVALPQKAVKNHLVIAFQLLQQIRPFFPRCMIIPFGSAISGLGTVTSDCDLCFFTDPPASLVLLSGSRYFSPPLWSLVVALEAQYGISFCPPRSVSTSPPSSSQSSNKSRGRRGSSSPSPSAQGVCTSKGSVFDQITSLIRKNKDMCKVYAVSRARCPIITFVHSNTSLCCDVSIDSW